MISYFEREEIDVLNLPVIEEAIYLVRSAVHPLCRSALDLRPFRKLNPRSTLDYLHLMQQILNYPLDSILGMSETKLLVRSGLNQTMQLIELTNRSDWLRMMIKCGDRRWI